MSAVEIADLTGRRPLLSCADLAECLSVSDRLARKLLAEGQIPSFLVGGCRRIAPADVDAFIESRRETDH